MAENKLSSSAAACLEKLRDAKDCKWVTDASNQGVKQLNNMLNSEAPLEPLKILAAVDKPVAGPYQKHLIQLKVRVAPKTICSPGATDISAAACDFDLKRSAIFQLLLSQPSTGTDQWTLVDSLQIQDSTASSVSQSVDDIVVVGVPQKASTATSGQSPFKFIPPYALEVLVVAACIFGLTALLVHTIRHRRTGYASVGQPHAQVKVRRVDLKRPNPVPRNEETTLRHSHEKNERFAV
ncbi:hypothetical protein H310_06602 [Aphanomyces invadans]|uniref:Uncharacterized protein n=1 Tax=Aphanomyces invadans TaxID=157072 RepID=A0A024U3Z7_9STRA|nr:hypothetical protein H310_06602 [Aphanomyces invadans]ETW00954.1 hypothetical protein H310_06602 [Aphanomyces invadans]|eukprot:XP_008869952.1 hypothetical protein H310_06602 [Aphanomyces invadans]